MKHPVEGSLIPVTHDLGAFKVRRVLPARGLTMVGPFCFVDQFGPGHFDIGQGMDVRPHPHIGLSTVTYLFEGAIDHRDSLGSFATIHPGAVNLMTAGKGIVHSERSPQAERDAGGPMYGMQTWLALPDGKEEIDPAFEQVAANQLPILTAPGFRPVSSWAASGGRLRPPPAMCQPFMQILCWKRAGLFRLTPRRMNAP